MQKIYFVLFFLISIETACAQFGSVNYIDTPRTLQTISELYGGDMNNDGLPDILASFFHFPDDSIRLYTNSGNQQYTVQTLALSTGSPLGRVQSFDAADINNDGLKDFVITWSNGTKLGWFENTGTSFTYHHLASNLDFTTKLLIRDFDNNGLKDILALQHVEIVLYRQTTLGNFSTGAVIHGGTEFYAIDAGYYNQDSLLDVSAASGGFEVLLNQGNGSFTLHSQTGLRLSFGLQSGDLDNDHDMDIAVYESLNGIMFYANNGNGVFTLKDTLLLSTDNFENYGIIDLDCDNDQDLYTYIRQLNRIVWVENRKDTGFSLPVTIHTQPGQLISAVTSADFNIDGKPDITWGNKHLGIHLNINPCPQCKFVLDAGVTGVVYQWQMDDGSGFINISDDNIFSGSNTNQLILTAAPTSWYGRKFRCLVNGNIQGTLHVLKFAVRWTGAADTSWENPANWNCGILPDENTDVQIAANVPNFPRVNSSGKCRSILLLPAASLRVKQAAGLNITGK